MCVFEVSNNNGVILNELLKNFFKTEIRTNINGKETIQIIEGKTEKDAIMLDRAIIDSHIVQDQGRSLWVSCFNIDSISIKSLVKQIHPPL